MAKSHQQLAEMVQSHRCHLKNADSRPQKAQRHRYERRKIREFIRLSDWEANASQA